VHERLKTERDERRFGISLSDRAEVALRLLSLPLFPIAYLSVFALQSLAQTAPLPGQDQVPVFKANARAVLVDVVVTDSHGNPVMGLSS
jgi:hypothetical protein